MRVTIGQINTTNGDYEGNVERCLRAIARARADESDLVVLPEVAVQGYMSFDWFLDRDVIAHALDPLGKIIEAGRGLTVVVGTVRPTGAEQGRKLFNSAAVISDGKLLGFADKTLLPEYDVFDDKMGQRCDMVRHRSRAAGIPVVYVNLVGANDGVIFDGASIVTDCRGETILQAPPFEEFYGSVDLDCGVRDETCLPGDDIATIHDALVLGIRDYARKNRFERAVLGLSGGLDSAVVAALACRALGPENVLSVMMPSPFSSRGSVDDSVALGKKLGMPVVEQPISAAYEVLIKQLNLTNPGTGNEELARQNIQSRLRGNILMTVSNSESRLLLSTGNKSELALGYCTLYGDTNGGLAVIGDVLKTDVYKLARHVNRAGEVIPWPIIEKRPSAELAPGQFDDQSLPPYDLLDPILKLYFERKATPEEIVSEGHDQQLVFDILNRVEAPANEFKRRQLPPTLIVS
ncbi:MAG: NAD(+) synthase, partial [Acidobacteria bacterium]|nr:NAD(+) synthase [Acidobacteriota bacterium]